MNDPSVTDKLIVSNEDGVGRLVFNQPEKRNAISYEMWIGMAQTLEAFAEDDSVRVVVLEGAGDRAFSAARRKGKGNSVPADVDGPLSASSIPA